MAEACSHEECQLLLPWVANGRLSVAERLRAEEHLRGCALCERELAVHHRLCEALTEPDRVTYAPAPSFRKLLDRIEGRSAQPREEQRAARVRTFASPERSAWRPPGIAWAASFLLIVGFAGLAATAYRWSQPLYATHTAAFQAAPDVLHIAFVPSLSIGEAGELLRSAGARVVEGPDTTGIFGVTPAAAGRADAESVSAQMRTLAARLRADQRVRWVEPLAAAVPAGAPERPAER